MQDFLFPISLMASNRQGRNWLILYGNNWIVLCLQNVIKHAFLFWSSRPPLTSLFFLNFGNNCMFCTSCTIFVWFVRMNKLELEVYNYLIYRGGQGYYFCPTQTQYGKKEFKKNRLLFVINIGNLHRNKCHFNFQVCRMEFKYQISNYI